MYTPYKYCPIDLFLMSKSFVNSLGLFCDIIGVYLLWKFGLPNRSAEKTQWESNKTILKSLEEKSKWGIILIIFGFVLQILSNWLPGFD